MTTDIRPVLAQYPSEWQPTCVVPLGSAGGFSGAEFWRVTTPGGTFALRRWPREHPHPDVLEFIHAVVSHAARHGCRFIPVPIATTSGGTFARFDDYLWELSPWMPGEADYQRTASDARLTAAVEAIATFHIAVEDFAPTRVEKIAALSNHARRLTELDCHEAERLTQAIGSASGRVSDLCRRIVAALPRAAPRALAGLEPLVDVPFRQQAVLGDVWHDHVLFTGDRVSGLIDFGAVRIDSPAADVARLLGSLAGDRAAGWRCGLEAYRQIGRLSDEERQLVRALDRARTVLAGANWVRWLFVEGRQFDQALRVEQRLEWVLGRLDFLANGRETAC